MPLVIADMHGDVKVRQDNDGNTDRPEIDRRDLRLMLLDAVPREKLQWGKKIEEVLKQETGEMAVRFTDGSSESGFQLVVGADGAWSKCRRLVRFHTLYIFNVTNKQRSRQQHHNSPGDITSRATSLHPTLSTPSWKR